MPTWNSIAPRVGVVYDLFGNQRTALKFSLGRYDAGRNNRLLGSYNPLR